MSDATIAELQNLAKAAEGSAIHLWSHNDIANICNRAAAVLIEQGNRLDARSKDYQERLNDVVSKLALATVDVLALQNRLREAFELLSLDDCPRCSPTELAGCDLCKEPGAYVGNCDWCDKVAALKGIVVEKPNTNSGDNSV